MRSRVSAILAALILLMTLFTPGARAATVCGAWNAVPSPNQPGALNRLVGVAGTSPSDVWAVGLYDADPDPMFVMEQTLIEHWNGTQWSIVPSPNVGVSGATLEHVAALAPDNAWAVGYSSTYGTPQTLMLHWNGSSWSVVPSPIVTGGSSLASISALSHNDIWAVGLRAGGMPAFATTTGTMIVHWDGASWTEIPSPNVGNRSNYLYSVSAISSNDVWAVGSWRHIGGGYQTLIEHWNGSSWSIVPSPSPSIQNALAAVDGVASNDVWAVGDATDGVTPLPLFFHWSGSSWTNVSSPGGPLGSGSGIVTIASNDAWAVGSSIAHWDGTSWSLVPDPTVPGGISLGQKSVAMVGPCEAWAVGSGWVAEEEKTMAARLTAGGGTINQPPVVTVSATPSTGPAPLTVNLSSAGSFDPDGTIVSYLWDFGDSTYPPDQTDPNPTHTYVQSGPLTYHATLRVTDNQGAMATANAQINITAPGTVTIHVQSQAVTRAPSGDARFQARDIVLITSADGVPIPDATVLASFLGPTSGTTSGITGADGRVTLQSTSTDQVAGTWCFDITAVAASGYTYLASANVVTHQCEISTPKAGQPVSSEPVIQVTNPQVQVAFVLSQPAPVGLRIYDVLGRCLRTVTSHQLLGTGAYTLYWDRHDDAGREVASGMYFIRLDRGDETSVKRVGLAK